MSLDIDIKKHFGTFTLDVAFQAEDETFGLLGASGCGKSLTMRCIAGIETPDEGHIIVNGMTFFDSQKKVNLTPQQRKTALLFQNYMLFPNLTVEQNVGAGIGKDVERDVREGIIAAELERFDIAAYRKRYPAQLSGGQQQRVALARMLAAQPQILMLDEPFSALDSHLKGLLEQSLIDLFSAFSGTILYVSHDIDEALRFCDRIAVVDNGKIKEIDAGREIVSKPKSLAALKISGCKNVTEMRKTGERTAFCPSWGISVNLDRDIPEDACYLGIRAFMLEVAQEPGPNVFRMRVDRVSESRFDRAVLLSFLDANPEGQEQGDPNEIDLLNRRLMWRIDLLCERSFDLPDEGDEVLIRLDARKIYLVGA